MRLLLSTPFPTRIYIEKRKEYFGVTLKNKYKRPKTSPIRFRRTKISLPQKTPFKGA